MHYRSNRNRVHYGVRTVASAGKDRSGHDFFKGTDADGNVCFYIGKKGDEFE